MKSLYLLPLLLMATTSYAANNQDWKTEPYIDKDALKYDLKIEQAKKKIDADCKGAPNEIACFMNGSRGLRNTLPVRGSSNYYKMIHHDLSKAEADKLLKRYSKIVTKVRKVNPLDAEDGEITWNTIQDEGRWIQSHIFHRNSLEPLVLSTGEVLPFYSLYNQ